MVYEVVGKYVVISVAVFDVILVGRVIKGENELEYIISRNSFVNWWQL
jgi:hypothetical protein